MKNNRGFTIVELVIVIAVIAVLAAVMIPTFSGIVKKANVSADISTARNMGTILAAEKPIGPREAVDALKANGFERLHPKTKFYSFYWIKSINTVVLTDEGVRPIFPEEMADRIFDPNDWFDLMLEYAEAEPETEEETVAPPMPGEDNPVETTQPPAETTSPPEYVSVTVTCNKPDYLKEAPISTTVKYGETYQFQLTPADGGQYWITKVSIYKGGRHHMTKHPNPGASFGYADITLTEDVEINIHVVKYCTVTFVGEGLKENGYTKNGLKVERGVGALFLLGDVQEKFIPSGYEIVSVTAKMGDRVFTDVYDPVKGTLHLSSITDNTVVTFEIREKQSN